MEYVPVDFQRMDTGTVMDTDIYMIVRARRQRKRKHTSLKTDLLKINWITRLLIRSVPVSEIGEAFSGKTKSYDPMEYEC